MTIGLSGRAVSIAASQTAAMNELARRLRAEGKDVIDLTVGEPDFPTPPHIVAAAKRALDEGYTRYTSIPGLVELREAICRKLSRENGLEYKPESVVVSCGAKQALANAMLALVDPGDEVIIPSPCWVSYTEMAKLAGGVPVLVPTRAASGYKLSAEALEAAITPRTKALVLCSPCNPTGAVYSRAELSGLVSVLERHEGIWLVSDEVYERIDYSGKRASPALFPSIAERCVVVNGVSKSYAMTGFRLGYLAARPGVAAACAKLQGQTTTSANSIAQRAALAALESDQSCVAEMVAAYARRRRLVLDRITRIPGLSAFEPEGAFYLFPEVSALPEWKDAESRAPGSGSAAVSSWLLEQASVATVPGSAFGDNLSIRISFAASDERLAAALDRIGALLAG